MPLDARFRGYLEKIIDGTLEAVPKFVQAVRHPKQNQGVSREPDEYAYGFVQGYIYASLRMAFIASKKREPNDEELNEIVEVIARRGAEIREAIFRAG
jgi:hypothetical protein